MVYGRARCLNETLSPDEAHSRVESHSPLELRWDAALNPLASETLDELRCAPAGHLGCRILPDATSAPAACCEKSFLDAAPHDFRLSDSQQGDSRWGDKALRQAAPLPLHDRSIRRVEPSRQSRAAHDSLPPRLHAACCPRVHAA